MYKNPKINRRSTQEPAILVGPMYLHWDGAFTTYHRFFSHLQSRLLSGVDCTEVGYSELQRPPTMSQQKKTSIAIAEYVGTFPANTSTHGNAIKSSNEYVRSSQQTIESIRSKVSTETSHKVYTTLVLND